MTNPDLPKRFTSVLLIIDAKVFQHHLFFGVDTAKVRISQNESNGDEDDPIATSESKPEPSQIESQVSGVSNDFIRSVGA